MADPAPPALAGTAQVLGADASHVGMATLVSSRRLVTCAHVVQKALGLSATARPADAELTLTWLSAPELRATATVLGNYWFPVDDTGTGDLAVLELASDAPDGVLPCTLADIPAPEGHAFVAYGVASARGYPIRADGFIRGVEGPAGSWVRIEARPTIGPAIQPGYSGAPVWDTQEKAAVGIVVARELPADNKSGFYLPFSKLIEMWPDLAQYVATAFERSREAREHWLPRARGVGSGAEKGWYFKGRQLVLDRITEAARGIGAKSGRFFCVTGAPGVGKSSILARLPVLADQRLSRFAAPNMTDLSLPGIDVIPIYLRQETYTSAVRILAERLDGEAETSDGLIDLISQRQSQPRSRSLILVFDGLDEALDSEARERIARDLVKRLAVTCSRHRVTVVVSCRSGVAGSENEALIGILGARCDVLRVDQTPYIRKGDIADFVSSRLLGDELSPYLGQDNAVATIATRVADAAFPVFLVAQLVVRSLLDDPAEAVATLEARRFPRDVKEAFDGYLARFGAERTRVITALRALSHARGSGFTNSTLWRDVASLLSGKEFTDSDIDWVLNSAAAFLIEAVDDRGTRRYRLYHQSLIDYFWRDGDARQVYDLLIEAVADDGADFDRDYFLEHLPGHAASAGAMEELLLTPSQLAHCRASAVVRGSARSDALLGDAAARSRVAISTVADLIDKAVDVGERLALYSLAGTLHNVPALVQNTPSTWWQVLYASWMQICEHRVLLRGVPVTHVVSEVLDGQRLILVGTADRRLLLLDAETGLVQSEHPTTSGVTALTSLGTADDCWVLLGLENGEVVIARFADGSHRFTKVSRFRAPVAAVALQRRRGGGVLVAAGDLDGSLLVQERPRRGRFITRRATRTSAVAGIAFMSDLTIAVATERGATELLSVETLSGFHGDVASLGDDVIGLTALDEREEGYRPVVAASGHELGVWELEYGTQLAATALTSATAMASNPEEPGEIVVGTGTRIELFYVSHDSSTPVGEFAGHEDRVNSVAVYSGANSENVVSASDDGTVRLWPVDACLPPSEQDFGPEVKSVCFDRSGSQFAMLDELGSVWVYSTGELARLDLRRVDHIGFVGDTLLVVRSNEVIEVPRPSSAQAPPARSLEFAPVHVLGSDGTIVFVGRTGDVVVARDDGGVLWFRQWSVGDHVLSAVLTCDHRGSPVLATYGLSGEYAFWSLEGSPAAESVDVDIYGSRLLDGSETTWVPFLRGDDVPTSLAFAGNDRLIIVDAEGKHSAVPLPEHAQRTGSRIAALPRCDRALVADGRSLHLVDEDGEALHTVSLGGGEPLGLWLGHSSSTPLVRFALSSQAGWIVGALDLG